MSMRDRLRRRKHDEITEAESQAPPPSTGPDEETVRIARKDFRRRRNAGRWRKLRLALLALLVVGAVAASVWVVFFSSLVTAEDVSVTGTTTLGDGRIERAADVPTGTPLARLDLDAIRKRVEDIASVRDAEVSRSWPHTVHIDVTERTPIAVINQGNGLQALDDQGVLFGHYAARPKRLPLVIAPPDTADEALVEGGRVIGSLPAGIASRVDTVEVSSVDKIQLVLGNGRRVLWGSSDDSGQKAEVLAVLLRRPGQQIDVSVPARPTTR
ncbi:cell division protein FtsQ/DivIB [Marmoricola sp. URHB0036]|uniref:cell division protein FtsQ/DivIB n=1 Tax=Marmoricola sp. URHB0036 TaxID=1298863 RepID=UPI0004176E83|nr:FtsQ-type POTRA domain-containing protein [Marmoricola sp. URHB0036]